MPFRRLLPLLVVLLAAFRAGAIVHSVTDFRLDFSGAASDTAFLDPTWGDSLLLNAQSFVYRSVMTKNLSDGLFNNGGSGASPVAAAADVFKFKVAYVAWLTAHTPGSAPPGDAPRGNVVTRDIDLSPDTAAVADTAAIIAGQEIIPDAFSPHKFGYLNPGSPPPPSYLNYAAEKNNYAAYWGSQSNNGPIRRTTRPDAATGAPTTWGQYVTPTSPVIAGGYGKVSSCIIPNTGGLKTVLAYETTNSFPAGSFEVRYEDVGGATSTAFTYNRPVFPDDFAVAADSDGNAVVMWRENANLYALAYSTTGAGEIMAPTLIQGGVFIQDTVTHWYRPYAVASMKRGHFVMLYSRVSGSANIVYSRAMTIPVAPAAYSLGAETRITGLTDYSMFPDLSVQPDRVVVAWFQRTGVAGMHRFMGSILQRTATDLDLTNRVDLDFAGEDISFGGIGSNWYRWHWLKSANVAMDFKGNVLAAYDNGYNAKVALVRNTPIYYDSGAYVSKIFKVGNPSVPSFTFNNASDSVAYLAPRPVSTDTSKNHIKLAVSPDNTFSAPGTGFQIISATSPLLSTSPFFRYRAELLTTKPTNLTTPKLKSLDLEYNVKPRLPIIDSIRPGQVPMAAFNPLGAYPLLPRKDSLKLVCTGLDVDDVSLEFRISLGGKLLRSVTGVRKSPGIFTATLALMPPDTVLNPLPLTITTVDDGLWSSQPVTINFDYSNIVPTQAVKVLRNRGRDSASVYRPSGGGVDTLAPAAGQTIIAQAGDTLTLKGKYADGNDDNVTPTLLRNSGTLFSQLISTNDSLVYKLPVDTLPPLVDTLSFKVGDPDTTVTLKLLVRPNRLPAVDSVYHAGYQTRDSVWHTGPFDRVKNFATDTGLTIPAGLMTVVQAGVSDPDMAIGDTVAVKWRVWKQGTGCARGNLACYVQTDSADGNVMTRVFNVQEQYLTVRVTDAFGAFKERKLWLEYPVLDTAGTGSAALAAAVKTLTGTIDFIIDAKVRSKAVQAEVTSQGSAPLVITSIATQGDDKKWLNVKTSWLTGTPPRPDSALFAAGTNANALTLGKTISLTPGAKLDFEFRFSSDSLRGDSVLTDTLLVQTNDFANPVLKIPFRITYNDLPVMRLGVPGAASAGPADGYNASGLPKLVPARSSLAISFSETVRISNPAQSFKVYSLLDSLKNPSGFKPIAGAYAYRRKALGKIAGKGSGRFPAGGLVSGFGKTAAATDSLADTLVFTPRYDRASDSLKVKPAPGFFIYRDILHIELSNGIVDRAGNSLDLRLDKTAQTPGTFDTVFQASVDTNVFRVSATQPAQGESGFDPEQPVRIRFNRKLSLRPPKGDDTLTRLNLDAFKSDSQHAVRVTSIYRPGLPYDFQMLSLGDGDSTLIFKTRPRLPALDTITVTLSGGILDTSGLSLDGNGDGFPRWLYDQRDSVDAYSFTFMTAASDFYVFPNPYRFSDPRHRDKGSITFKNLNSLSGYVKGQEVVLRVHTITGDLVYDSHSAPDPFGLTGRRQYASLDWNLANGSGSTVGTGVYVYTLTTGNSKLLRKGKVAVVR